MGVKRTTTIKENKKQKIHGESIQRGSKKTILSVKPEGDNVSV